jgi:HD-GYP domain-containing protein (c-di-GMP phosphodiesterase class II)
MAPSEPETPALRRIPEFDPAVEIRMSDLVIALSEALDLNEGQPPGHAQRSCLIAMKLGKMLELDPQTLSDLYYAALVKDAGSASTIAHNLFVLRETDPRMRRDRHVDNLTGSLSGALYALRNVAQGTSLERLQEALRLVREVEQSADTLAATLADRTAEIAYLLGLSPASCAAIQHLHEHFDGNGYPHHLRGQQIPLLARILNLVQSIEIFITQHGLVEALNMVGRRRGLWFDPELTDLVTKLRHDHGFWETLHPSNGDLRQRVIAAEPAECRWIGDQDQVDRAAIALANVVDAKSRFTSHHSQRVAAYAQGIAQLLGHTPLECREICRAGLLHDIGKLAVPRRVLEKPDKLDKDEWRVMWKHTHYTLTILERTQCLRHLALMAACHHERLDGDGYHFGMDESLMPWGSRILAVADYFDAVSADRPYRAAMPIERAIELLDGQAPKRLCATNVDALKQFLARSPAELPTSHDLATTPLSCLAMESLASAIASPSLAGSFPPA